MYENKSHRNKKIALAAALAVAIIALAGVGFAAAGHLFTGTTQSATQDMNAEYVTVSLSADDGATAYVASSNTIHIWYDSDNNAGTIKYNMVGAESITYKVTVDSTAVESGDTVAVKMQFASIPSIPNATIQYTVQKDEAAASGAQTLTTDLIQFDTFTDGNDHTYIITVTVTETTDGFSINSVEPSYTFGAVTFTAAGTSSEA